MVREDELNLPELRRMKRLCLFICPDCGYKNFFGYHIKYSKLPVQCKNGLCNHILDPLNDCVYDSYHADDYPGYGARKEGYWPDGGEKITLYVETECIDCHKKSWIPYRKSHLCYDECECHAVKPTPLIRPVAMEVKTLPQPKPVVVPPEPKVIIDGDFEANKKIKQCLMEYLFDNNMVKEEFIREAVVEKLRAEGYNL